MRGGGEGGGVRQRNRKCSNDMLTVLMVVARCNGHRCMKEEGVRCVVLAGTGSEGCQGARGGMDGGTEISWIETSPDLRSGGMSWTLSIGNGRE